MCCIKYLIKILSTNNGSRKENEHKIFVLKVHKCMTKTKVLSRQYLDYSFNGHYISGARNFTRADSTNAQGQHNNSDEARTFNQWTVTDICNYLCVNSPARAFACSQTTDLCRLKIKVSYNDSLFVSLKQIEYFFLPFAFGFWTNKIEISSENVNSAFYFA